MNDDLMRRLRAADPAARVAPVADDAMRETIMTTDVTARPTVARGRRVRRGLLAGALATVLVGGGAAYAGLRELWYVSGGGGHEGVTCVTRWDAPREEASGGPWITGDAVADCAQYQELSGLPPIEDAVAFRIAGDPAHYVAPRAEAPSEAELVDSDPQQLAVRELDSSMRDWVDGGRAQCLDEADAVAWAESELARLGLDGWTVRVEGRPVMDDRAEGVEGSPGEPLTECAGIGLAYDWDALDASPAPTAAVMDGADHTVPRTLAVTPLGAERLDDLRGVQIDEAAFVIRDTLREQIAERCVDLGTAEGIARAAVGEGHHWPFVVVEDPTADCTRVDMTGGGSIQISLRGPRS